MMPRQSFYAPLAALFLAGAIAAPAQAATKHHVHRAHAANHARSSHVHATSARSSQDHSADALNAQSLERSQAQSGAMQAPAAAPATGAPQ